MYTKMNSLFNEYSPFGGMLNAQNRWVKLSDNVPWDQLEGIYKKHFERTEWKTFKDCRLILGLLIAKHFLKLSDRDIVMAYHENPYLQHFCGRDCFDSGLGQQGIHPSLLSKRRKRLGKDFFERFESEIIQALVSKGLIKIENLKLDATVFPSNIAYPNDVKVMNTAREWLCKTILKIKQAIDPKRKIRTYRKMGRKLFLNFQKKKRKSKKVIEKAKKKMARYLKRNIKQLQDIVDEYKEKFETRIGSVKQLPGHILGKVEKKLLTAQEIYNQQLEMIREKKHTVKDRIVSFHQEYVRPIMRGKEGRSAEFGPKGHLAIIDGYACLDKLSFDNFNEGILLEESIKKFKERFGNQPKNICIDQIYSNRNNRKYLQKKKINSSLKLIGQSTKEQKKTTKKLNRARNEVEGKIGTLKTRWTLDKIRYTVPGGEFIQTYLSMGVMNLYKAAMTG